MNQPVKNIFPVTKIFDASPVNFRTLALEVFKFQHKHNLIYRQFCDNLKIDADNIQEIWQIPFLPVSFFKSHEVVTKIFKPEAIFESSGTSHGINSRHIVKELSIYKQSFTNTFNSFYGKPTDWCILALLPAYLERKNSSLVMMADKLIAESGHPHSGFYLYDFEKLSNTLLLLEAQKQQTILIGVTFALLDFAEQYPMILKYTTIMETGGMKGRRQEITRQEVHEILCNRFRVAAVHSEYGMTELLSQAYSYGNGIFKCAPWMKILLREEDDPLTVHVPCETVERGAVNIIDLANIYSVSFIATDDGGKLYADGSFEVLGRIDHSEIRGCSLMAL